MSIGPNNGFIQTVAFCIYFSYLDGGFSVLFIIIIFIVS